MAITAGSAAGLAAGLASGLVTAVRVGLFVLVIGHGDGLPTPITGLGWSFRPARSFRAWRNNRLSTLLRLTVPTFAIVGLLVGLVFGLAAAAAWLIFGLLVLGVYAAHGDLTDFASPQAVLAPDRRTLLAVGILGVIYSERSAGWSWEPRPGAPAGWRCVAASHSAS